MGKEINIAELLKDCPKGMELYSPMFGIVYFQEVRNTGRAELIIVTTSCNSTYEFYNDGKFNTYYSDSEMLLFPSKNQRDWSKFQRPFKDGDIIYIKSVSNIEIIAIYKKEYTERICGYCSFVLDSKSFYYNTYGIISKNNIDIIRLATEEEKQKIFDAIKANDYKWNAETKTLEKLEVKKFDITTLKAFDKVLVRDENRQEWVISLFSHCNRMETFKYSCVNRSGYAQCIPYEGNQELLGTTKDCDEYYKNWI